ncbi:uncharacterized protein LOC127248703 isoform X2 [Andrographis paniculata]|uniref:uncharacterized protein LOC127248703 isoform X2 n=1 Tax=Andrographis paniculata TaxID=175694 RepID=UPI0021E704E4|nr:uncharacterized protein LOC127248703 isoform X2 [Andrographis paniculata]
MSLALRSLSSITINSSTQYNIPSSPNPNFISASPNLHFPSPNSRPQLLNHRLSISQTHVFAAASFDSVLDEPDGDASRARVNGNGSSTSFDAFLSILEFLSLVSSAAASVYIAVRCGIKKGGSLGLLESKVLLWQCAVLAGGLVAGAVIRRRQWRRICGVEHLRWPVSSRASLLEKVEKLENDLNSSSVIVQAIERRLEKLRIRFRVNRKALKEPMAEMEKLIQKNSDATQALITHEGILEKELGEIQKVMLSMQFSPTNFGYA